MGYVLADRLHILIYYILLHNLRHSVVAAVCGVFLGQKRSSSFASSLLAGEGSVFCVFRCLHWDEASHFCTMHGSKNGRLLRFRSLRKLKRIFMEFFGFL